LKEWGTAERRVNRSESHAEAEWLFYTCKSKNG